MENSYLKILLMVFFFAGLDSRVAPDQTQSRCAAECNRQKISYCTEVISNAEAGCRFREVFCAAEEAYVDDIPFDTGEIVKAEKEEKKADTIAQNAQPGMVDLLVKWIKLVWQIR